MCTQTIDISSIQRSSADHITTLKEHEKEIEYLHCKIAEIEGRLVNQEQYSRRTSLRFHNIPVPTDERGRVIHPVDTDQLVLNVINNKLKLENVTINDIGRSHVIGKVRNGKSYCPVYFLSYEKSCIYK